MHNLSTKGKHKTVLGSSKEAVVMVDHLRLYHIPKTQEPALQDLSLLGKIGAIALPGFMLSHRFGM